MYRHHFGQNTERKIERVRAIEREQVIERKRKRDRWSECASEQASDKYKIHFWWKICIMFIRILLSGYYVRKVCFFLLIHLIRFGFGCVCVYVCLCM